MKDKIVIIGGGGHAKLIINTIKKLDKYEIIGYTDIINKGSLLGINYLGDDTVLSGIFTKDNNCKAVIGIVPYEVSNKRQDIYNMLKKIGFELPVIISKSAIINEEVNIGEGTVVLEKAMINVCSNVGKCVMIDSCAIIEHDCNVGNFVHMAVGSIIGGEVEIADGTIIGVGAKVIQGKKIGHNCLIGEGSIVVNNILIEGTYFGIPARRFEINDEFDRMIK
ncbi:MAG TPA: hypothetical protein DHV28_01000 [Ignavibacteriales bacterium]|nr:hypothetical protein [Ignavibacteriales bacterium]